MTAGFVDSISLHGPDWVALLIVVWLLKRVLEKQYAAFRSDRADMKRFTDRAVEAMERIAAGCSNCHDDMVSSIKVTAGKTADQVLESVRDMGNDANEATGNIILALAQKERGIVGAIEGLLIGLRNDLAGMHSAAVPPAGGVGSQVRDSAEGVR